MIDKALLLHYDSLTQFKKAYHKNLLTTSNIVDEEKYFKNLTNEDGEEYVFNEFCYVLKKDGKKYLFESRKRQELPIIVKRSEKFAHRGDAYHLVRDFDTARFKPIKAMSFKELVDSLASFSHTNPDGYKLSWMLSLLQLYERMNYRLSTPPGYGKDSVVDLCGNLFGGAATIENPTIAKLEYMTVMRLLAINEVCDITPENWRHVQQFILQTGAFKPEATKHSRAIGGVNEILNLSEFSLVLMYNDVDCYTNLDHYLDNKASKPVKDRFLPFRIWGVLNEDFNRIKDVDVERLVADHYQFYKDLISTFYYYKLNYIGELKRYSTLAWESQINKLPERHKINLGKIFRAIDLYSSNQEEFDRWVGLLFNYHDDYQVMLEYPSLIENLLSKKDKLVGGYPLEEREKRWLETLRGIHGEKTFVDKKKLILKLLRSSSDHQPARVNDLKFWE